jgi:Glucosamine 6-phosphate synthetase, contains amidotransferase and phosphosugar isomerase domains
MCGIVGLINAEPQVKFGETAAAVFRQLLWHSTERGWNGTGVLAVNGYTGHYKPTMYKNALWAPDYLQYQTYRSMIQPLLPTAKVVIGHNRATTRGSVRHENAHPFEHKHITLVQNGYINNHRSHLPKGVDHDVDSYTAAYLVGEKGAKAALEEMVFGGVFVWWNQEDGTLNMARNEHRELYCVGIKDHNAMFYASEYEMLHWILKRNGLEPETKYLLLSPNAWFKFDPAKPKEWTKVPFADAPSQNTNQRGQSGGGAATTAGAGSTTYNVNGDSDNKKEGSKRPDQITDAELNYAERSMERLSAKQKSKYGIPESRVKLRKVMAKIENTGIAMARFGAKFIVYPDAWIPYKNQQQLGLITGSKRADATISVELPNSTKEDYDRLLKDSYAFATVVNAKKKKSGGWALVMALIPEAPMSASGPASSIKTHTKTDGTQATLIKGPRGSYIELAKFQAMIQGGCAYCTGSIKPSEAETVAWFGEEPICSSCSENPKICEELGFNLTRKVH